MGSELRFDDKVVIITGAGGGLGRAHALLFASRGAKVVVNDLGGGMHGKGKGSEAADKVVAEIKEAGGQAVANYDSVEDGAAIVKTAIDTWGRVDVLVNNAGILRDVSFHKMSVEDWDLINRVHVSGSFRCSHAAWPYMREQGYGRIIMTASAAGIYGNFGQANYSAAKLGLLGFGNTLAIEGHKRNIHVNTVAPIAGSRLTETVLPQDLVDALKPEFVSPLVAWLCHEDCSETGGLYEVGGGFFSKLRWQRSKGVTVRLGKAITPELVASQSKAITSFEDVTYPATIHESTAPIMENIQAGPSKGGNDLVDVDLALGYEYPEQKSQYTPRDLALYALGIGAGKDPSNDADLRLVYEMHGAGMTAFPTFAVIPAMRALIDLTQQGHKAPGLNYGLDRLLHGEQYTEVLRPLPPSAKLTHRARIKEIWDKGKGAVINTETETYDDSGELLAINQYIYFIRGAGDFGGERGPASDVNRAPDRKPDAVVEQRVDPDQALLYRLSGDVNPLHVDPGFAKAFGFERPILHGLCTYGHAARHVVNAFAKDGDPRYFKSIKVRFVKSVYPGDTLVTEMWKESDQRIVFRTKVKERDEVVIENAAVELYKEIPKPIAKAKPAAAPAARATEPTSADIFQAIGAHIAADKGICDKVGKVFQFQLSAPDSAWLVDVKNGAGGVTESEGAADCTLQLSDADFMAMCTGKADAMKLFSSGALKISGDIMASQKLGFLKKLDPQRVVDAMKARAGSRGASPPAAAAPQSGDVFLGINAYVGANADLVDRVGKVFRFELSDPASVWTLDLKNNKGSCEPGGDGAADTTLAMADGDFMDMTSGKADAMKLFSTGKLKISGDIMASQKLSFLSKIDPEWAKAEVAKMKKSAPAAAPANHKSAAPKQASAPAIIAALRKRLAENPGLAAEVKATIELRVADPDAAWTLRLLEQPSIDDGLASGKADTTLTIADADLLALTKGQASAQQLFQQGKLRVDGDVRVAQRLGFFKNLA
jgi:3-hydroxyacyl-CoA dehydrogenase/3a,7a,12a-trihydroxy-5b-cholest-24-enoyl-CoA hydratase